MALRTCRINCIVWFYNAQTCVLKIGFFITILWFISQYTSIHTVWVEAWRYSIYAWYQEFEFEFFFLILNKKNLQKKIHKFLPTSVWNSKKNQTKIKFKFLIPGINWGAPSFNLRYIWFRPNHWLSQKPYENLFKYWLLTRCTLRKTCLVFTNNKTEICLFSHYPRVT
jgi:hypothetical protein